MNNANENRRGRAESCLAKGVEMWRSFDPEHELNALESAATESDSLVNVVQWTCCKRVNPLEYAE